MAPPVSKLIVFGGNGFVGSAIIASALKNPAIEKVYSVCRSGALKSEMHGIKSISGYEDKIEWMKGDISKLEMSNSARETQEWEGEVAESTGVISCVGMFDVSNDIMRKMNGDANKALAETVKRAGAAHMVYISAYEVEKEFPFKVLPGYFEGKRIAEAAVSSEFGSMGAILQPGMIYGTRVQNGMSIPLGLIGKPLEVLFSLPGLNQLHKLPIIGRLAFSPPVNVHDIAKASVLAATGGLLEDSSKKESGKAHILSIERIRQIGGGGE